MDKMICVMYVQILQVIISFRATVQKWMQKWKIIGMRNKE